jgi:hypothetical protein
VSWKFEKLSVSAVTDIFFSDTDTDIIHWRELNLIMDWLDTFSAKMKGSPKVFREIMYGLMLHEMDMEMKKEKGHLDNLFMLVVFGDLVGLPLLPPYYSMRLLPHIIPSLEMWKRRLLREKDLTDFVAHDL